MSYFDVLPSDIIFHIISKLTIEGIQHLSTIVDVDDIQYKFLYSLNFKHIYDNYVNIFNLDDSKTWKEHYLQMFKLHNLMRCYYDSATLNVYGKLTVDDGIFLTKMNSHETEYQVHDLVLSSFPSDIPNKVENVLNTRARFHIPDYYIINIVELLKDKKLKELKPRKRGLLFYIWIYSKVYAGYILNQIDFNIYYYTSSVSMYSYVDIYQDLMGDHTLGPERLRHADITYIRLTDDPDVLYSKYRMTGLYFKYLINHHLWSVGLPIRTKE